LYKQKAKECPERKLTRLPSSGAGFAFTACLVATRTAGPSPPLIVAQQFRDALRGFQPVSNIADRQPGRNCRGGQNVKSRIRRTERKLAESGPKLHVLYKSQAGGPGEPK
jgi:hypothetical protein